MDVNGTRFHLLLGKDDWATCTDGQTSLGQAWDPSFPNGNTTGFDWDDSLNELTLQSRLFQFVAAPKDKPPTLDDRRGAGCDRYGNWYWFDETRREIRVNSVGTGVTSHFWSVGDGVECTTGELATSTRPGAFQPREPKPAPAPLQLSGLAVTDEHYLVVGVVEPAGLLIFDLYAVGSPQQVLWPKTVPFAPFDMAPAPCGGVWILDRDYKRFWRLNRQFNVLKPDQAVTPPATTPTSIFQPTDGSAPQKSAVCIPTYAISLDASSPLVVENPIAIEGLPDDTILILESKPGDAFSHIYRYHYSKLLGKPVSTEVMGELIEKNTAGQPKPFRLLGYDFAFVPERKRTDGTVGAPDQLYIAADNGNQAFAFLLSQQNDFLDMRPLPDYFPMRHFGGKGLVTAYGQVYYDFGNVWLPLIAQPRRRYVPEAVLYTHIDLSDQDVSSPPMSKPRHALDGRTPDCVWHRLMLDACIPPGAQVRVWSRAANVERDLPITAWRQEPPFYLRGDGSELPFVG